MAFEKDGIPDGEQVEKHMFVCATGDTNHNKYWECSLFDSGDVHIRFGRIGKTETKGVGSRGGGTTFMSKKIREKEKGKVNKKTGEREPYTEIPVLDGEGSSVESGGSKNIHKSQLKSIAIDQIEYTSKETKDLIEWLADVNRHNITDATGGQIKFDADSGMFKTPLGIVPPSSISLARDLLIQIADSVVKKDFDDKTFKKNVEEYLTFIPHNLGMKWSPRSFVPNINAVQKENGILDALDASYVTATTQVDDGKKAKKEEKKVFETKLIEVSSNKIIRDVTKMFKSSINSMHRDVSSMKIHKVWDVDIKPMTESFVKVSGEMGNIMDLWHGTQAANLLSILKVGLVIPPSNSSHCTGRMFGDGVYASDQSTKALNYATSFWGGKDVGRYFMFIVQFAMGRMYSPSGYGSRKPDSKKYDSTFAKAGVSGVRNNEMIVYNTKQVCLKKLIEFRR